MDWAERGDQQLLKSAELTRRPINQRQMIERQAREHESQATDPSAEVRLESTSQVRRVTDVQGTPGVAERPLDRRRPRDRVDARYLGDFVSPTRMEWTALPGCRSKSIVEMFPNIRLLGPAMRKT